MFFAVVAADNGYIYYVTDDSPHNSVLDIEFYHFLTASTTDSEWIRRL